MQRLCLYSFCLFLGLTLAYGLGSHFHDGLPFERLGYVLGRDFLNLWMAGQAAWQPDPGRYYDLATYNQALIPLVGKNYILQQWSYPPTLLLLAAPFGRLPYLAAYGLWTLLGLGALGLALRGLHLSRLAWALVMLSPAAFACLLSGQSSFFTAAILLTIFRHAATRPIGCGLLLALLSIKPQLALMVPFWLIFQRQWRSLAWAVFFTLALIGLSLLLDGPDIWQAYLRQGLPAQSDILRHTPQNILRLMPTLFMDLHQMGVPYTTALGAQMLVALGCVLLLWRFGQRTADPSLRLLAFTAASLLGTPYLMAYDLLPFTIALVWLLQHHAVKPRDEGWVGLNIMLPVVKYGLAGLHLPGTALLPAGMMVWAWRQSGAKAPAPPPASPDALPARTPRNRTP